MQITKEILQSLHKSFRSQQERYLADAHAAGGAANAIEHVIALMDAPEADRNSQPSSQE